MSERPSDEAKTEAAVASEDADGRAYHVKLPMFEGPLDLLLHLIQKHELNILDIPIGFVALKYVEYIRMMEEMSIDLASEYLVMAATLAHIKSRSLLPPDPTQETEEGAEEEEEDPRAELIRKLLEYQKYKHAADNLGQREVLGRDVFQRGVATEPNDEEAPLAPMSLFKLVDAFESVLKRVKQVQEHQIDFEKVSISDRIGQIVERLRTLRTLQFEQLFDGDVTRAEMIVTFLALLEMTKLRMTRLAQEGPLAPIVVELVLSADQARNFDAERAFEQMHHAVEQDFAADKPWSEQEPDPAVVETSAWEANVDDLELSEEELAEELREAAQAFALGERDVPRADPDLDPEADGQLSTFGPPDDDDFFDAGDAEEGDAGREPGPLEGPTDSISPVWERDGTGSTSTPSSDQPESEEVAADSGPPTEAFGDDASEAASTLTTEPLVEPQVSEDEAVDPVGVQDVAGPDSEGEAEWRIPPGVLLAESHGRQYERFTPDRVASNEDSGFDDLDPGSVVAPSQSEALNGSKPDGDTEARLEPKSPSEAEALVEPELPSEAEALVEPELPSEAEALVEPELPSEAEALVEPELPSEAEALVEPELPSEADAEREPEATEPETEDGDETAEEGSQDPKGSDVESP